MKTKSGSNLGFGIWGGNCKPPAVCAFQGPFPLTPALSHRERENQGRCCDNFKRLGLSNALPMMHPLPEGEGWGGGEWALERADGGNLAIGPGIWDLDFSP